MNDKEIKKWIKEKASKEPEKFYPIKSLKEMGFERYTCKYCGRHFWSSKPRDYCDDPVCREKAGELPYGFIGNPPTKIRMSYPEAWRNGWMKIFKKFDHTPIKRYPVVARWRDDVYFVQASIYDFQPHVVSGEVEPPANPLLVPQFCLRFNDVDNVGLSGRHYTGFVMVGEHAFNTPKKYVYFKEEGIKYIHKFLNELGIKDEDIIFHEDGWAGGGNFGVSIEFFSRGLEVGNQVYMQYEMTQNGPKELKTKVIDMGAGLERTPWILNGTPTSYDNVFPKTLKYITSAISFKKEGEVWNVFPQYAAILNADEMNIEDSWKEISKKTGYDVEFLKKHIYTMRDVYAVADHIRTLMIAINDGALPSNSGGGYNLRYILRRVFSITKNWNVDIHKIIEMENEDVKELFPEISEMVNVIKDVIDVEKKRFEETKRKSEKIILKYVKKKITTEDFITLYESYGISPESIVEESKKIGKQIEVPSDFYARLEERKNLSKKEKEKSFELDVSGVERTEDLYHSDISEFDAKVIKIIGKWVILDRTGFYPESGGQEYDTGFINNSRVINVQKFKGVVAHLVDEISFKVGDVVHCKINMKRRKQLTINHTATHLINAAAQRILGKHVWQHGAHKSEKKAHLDITHYKPLTEQEIKQIESLANKFIKDALDVKIEELNRTEAERRYTVRIYQGGAVPGKILRIVSVDDIDHEACGGTHVKNTKEIEKIYIIKTERIQDGIVRIEFVAGPSAKEYEEKMKKIVEEISKILNCKKEEIIDKVKKLKTKLKENIKLEREITRKNVKDISSELEKKVEKINGIEIIVAKTKHITDVAKSLQREGRIVVLSDGEKIFIISKSEIHAGKLAKEICNSFGGKGGGNEKSAQGIVKWNESMPEFIKQVIEKWRKER